VLVIDGVSTNIAKQIDLVGDEDFLAGEYDTGFMEKRGE
jgi:biotin carboxylase